MTLQADLGLFFKVFWSAWPLRSCCPMTTQDIGEHSLTQRDKTILQAMNHIISRHASDSMLQGDLAAHATTWCTVPQVPQKDVPCTQHDPLLPPLRHDGSLLRLGRKRAGGGWAIVFSEWERLQGLECSKLLAWSDTQTYWVHPKVECVLSLSKSLEAFLEDPLNPDNYILVVGCFLRPAQAPYPLLLGMQFVQCKWLSCQRMMLGSDISISRHVDVCNPSHACTLWAVCNACNVCVFCNVRHERMRFAIEHAVCI